MLLFTFNIQIHLKYLINDFEILILMICLINFDAIFVTGMYDVLLHINNDFDSNM